MFVPSFAENVLLWHGQVMMLSLTDVTVQP